MYPSSVLSALHGHSKFKFLFAGKTPCQRADNHSIHWTLRTWALALTFRLFCLRCPFPIAPWNSRSCSTMAFRPHRLCSRQEETPSAKDHLLTPKNSALIIIDYQPVQVNSIASMGRRSWLTTLLASPTLGGFTSRVKCLY